MPNLPPRLHSPLKPRNPRRYARYRTHRLELHALEASQSASVRSLPNVPPRTARFEASQPLRFARCRTRRLDCTTFEDSRPSRFCSLPNTPLRSYAFEAFAISAVRSLPSAPLRMHAFEAWQPPRFTRCRTHRSDCHLEALNSRRLARCRTHRFEKHTSRGLALAAVCSLPNAPLRLHASGLASWASPLGLTTVCGQLVAEPSAPTVRRFWGLPLGPRNRAICSLPNISSDRTPLGIRNRRRRARCRTIVVTARPCDVVLLRLVRYRTHHGSLETFGPQSPTNCPFPNAPPQPQPLTVAGSQPPVHHTAQDSAVLRVSAPPHGEADAGRLLPPRPPKRWRPSSVRAHLAACVHLG